jgi:polyferredoxin
MANQTNESLSLANPNPPFVDMVQKIALAIGTVGLLILLVATFGYSFQSPGIMLTISLLLMAAGVIIYSYREYLKKLPGIKNDGVWFSGIASRGALGWIAGVLITSFYVLLYWYPTYLGMPTGVDPGNTGLIALFDPLSLALKGQPASQWFVYGTLYTFAILTFGIKFIWKYRHNRYQVLRTISVMFFQFAFAFLLPEILQSLNYPYNDFKNMWPLNYYFFYDWNINSFLSSGNIGMFMLIWGIAMILIISPALTYFYGKRWYCSWVCGCGGLAETAGDPFRHLSDKSLRAWKIERWMIHSVLVFAVLMTFFVLYTYFTGKGFLGISPEPLKKWYGFLIGAAFSGVVGVGFYPLMGSRVWCRFGCPMAAILGIQQKFFSRFRITTNGGQCISCGNCSTYCEMGIDVRWYAQRGQNIVRASCVGCGICSAVCPRGVLRLENGSLDISDKTAELRTVHVKENEVSILS